MGKWSDFGSDHRFLRCNWLLPTLDQVGYWAVKIVSGVPESNPRSWRVDFRLTPGWF